MEASNLQKLKDAATELMRFTCNSCERRLCEEDAEEEDGQRVPSPCSAIIRMQNALSANPIRNCDIGTAEEQSERFMNFCRPGNRPPNCEKCKIYPKRMNKFWCQLEWAQMPYEAQEGGAGNAND